MSGGSSLAELLPALYWTALVLILIWNIATASQSARVRRAGEGLVGLTALCGLLIAPAVLVALASPSMLAGRTLHVVGWLWPLVAIMCTVQALLVLALRHAPIRLAGPLTIYNGVVALLAVSRWSVGVGFDPGDVGTALLAAQSAATAPFLGAAALESGNGLLIPVIAPLFPARWAIGRVARPTLAVLATAWTVLVLVVALPRAVRAAGGFAAFEREVPAAGTDPALLIGLELFGELDGPPPGFAVRNDLALLDTLGGRVASITVRPEGATIAALDSLARTLAPYRSDSVPLMVAVTLGYDRNDATARLTSPDEYAADRIRRLSAIVRMVRPDVVFPAPPPFAAEGRTQADLPLEWWTGYLTAAADEIHRLRPRTRVGVSLSRYDARDSALYAWASARDAPVDLVGLALFPNFDGAAGLDARLNAANRWITASPRPRKPHWVSATGSFPYSFGESSQRLTLRRTLAWASREPAIRAFIIADAADYGRLTGLRVPSGRLRPAVDEMVGRREGG